MGEVKKRHDDDRQYDENEKHQREARRQPDSATARKGQNDPADHHQERVTELYDVAATPEEKLEVNLSVHHRRDSG